VLPAGASAQPVRELTRRRPRRGELTTPCSAAARRTVSAAEVAVEIGWTVRSRARRG